MSDEDLFLSAYNELEEKEFDKEIFGKSLAQADGKIEEAKNLYIKLRVESLKK